MTAIIIPAHNEAAVIERTLSTLGEQLADSDEVIVVCNGCTDDTAKIARRFSPRMTVLETEVPSKTNALNLGDDVAVSFPRIYMDADVVLSGAGSLATMVRVLESGPWLAASPTPLMELGGASWAVRAYYDVWLSLPYCRSGMLGAGVYGLSREGRNRFGRFPDVIADDGFVRALFKEHERGRVDGALSIVRAPASLEWLLKIKARSRLGGMELARKFPDLMGNETKDYAGALRGLFAKPSMWPKVVVYLYVNLMSRMRARRRFRKLSDYKWEKDLSSRSS